MSCVTRVSSVLPLPQVLEAEEPEWCAPSKRETHYRRALNSGCEDLSDILLYEEG